MWEKEIRVIEQWSRLPGEAVDVRLCKMFKMMFKTQLDVVWSNAVASAVSGLDQKTSRDAFQPQLFCDLYNR